MLKFIFPSETLSYKSTGTCLPDTKHSGCGLRYPLGAFLLCRKDRAGSAVATKRLNALDVLILATDVKIQYVIMIVQCLMIFQLWKTSWFIVFWFTLLELRTISIALTESLFYS